jgi:hypothetical protein
MTHFLTIKWTGHGTGFDLSNHVPKNRLAHPSSQITRTWSLESCEKVARKCRESTWNSRRSKLRSPDIAHIFAECHLILSPLGSLSYDSPDNICVRNHLSLSPLGTLSYDSPNKIRRMYLSCNHFGQHYTIISARFLDTIIRIELTLC